MRPIGLVFDFFGVISSEAAPFWFEEHMSREEGRMLEEKYVRPADKGKMTQEELFKNLSDISGIKAEEIEANWLSRARINSDVVDLVKELKGSYRLGLLTNAFSPFFTTVLERSGVKDLFEEIVMSSETGYAKPEPEMYRAILEKMNLEPEEVLMIDDNPKNVEGAKNIGMSAVVFTSCAELREDLERWKEV